jgi:Glycosyl transferases group 1
MRILFSCHLKYNMMYGIMHKLVHGLIRCGHNVMVFDDRRAARAATWMNSRKFGIGAANKRFFEACVEFTPDVVILGHCEMIHNDTIHRVREAIPHVRIVYRNDDPLMHTRNVADIHNRTTSADWIFLTTAGKDLAQFSGKRAKITHIPNPVDRVIDSGRGFEHSNQPFDVFYAIGGVYKDDPRPGFVAALQAACPDSRFDLHGITTGNLFGAAYYQGLARAKMGLNFSRKNDVYLYSSDRMAQYMGNGLLTFIDRATGFGDIFSEDQVGFYSNREELAEKIRLYTKDDAARMDIAKAGWERIHTVFASETLGTYMIECAIGEKLSREYAWDLTVY